MTEKLTDHGGVEMETASEASRGTTDEDQAVVAPLFPVRSRSRPPRAVGIAQVTAVPMRVQARASPMACTRIGTANLAYTSGDSSNSGTGSPPDGTSRDASAPTAESEASNPRRRSNLRPYHPFPAGKRSFQLTTTSATRLVEVPTSLFSLVTLCQQDYRTSEHDIERHYYHKIK